MKSTIGILIVVYSFFVNAIPAQNAWTIFNQANSALPADHVFCLEEDSAGNIWAGTENGLARYDGNSWTVFADTNSGLTSNSVRSLKIDSAGIIWVGTDAGGLFRFDGTNWTNYNYSNSGVPDNFVRGIEELPVGTLWLATPSGIVRFNGTDWRTWSTLNSTLASSSYTVARKGRGDTLLMGALNGGLVVMRDTNILANFTLSNSGILDNFVHDIAVDSVGNIWLCSPQHSLGVLLTGNSWYWYQTTTSPITSPWATSVWIDDNGKKYIGTYAGLNTFEGGSTWNVFNTTNSGIPDNVISDVFKSSAGIVWIATDAGGVARLDESLLVNIGKNRMNGFVLYPNPAKAAGNFRIISSFQQEMNFEILDLNGHILQSGVFTSGSEIILSAQLSPGIYLVKIECGEGNSFLRIFLD